MDLLLLMVMVHYWLKYKEIQRMLLISLLLIYQKNMVEEDKVLIDLLILEKKKDLFMLKKYVN